MTTKNQPGGITGIFITGLAILLLLLGLIFAEMAKAAATNYSLTDTKQLYAKNGKAIGRAPAVQTPYIAFTDLISCPDTGLGDGLGSGCIVTVWGQKLGSTQGTSTIQFCDSLSVCRTPHVYYWKNADGQLPGGPANLHESHGMQEIAFSIPAGADGQGRIKIVVDGKEAVTSTTPDNLNGHVLFMVRPGNIYHVMPTGNDTTGNGSFGNPWLTVDRADGGAEVAAGDTLYVHNVTSGNFTGEDRAIYNNNPATSGDESLQFAYVAYPNTRPEAIGHRGFANYQAGGTGGIDGIVQSKFSVYAADADTDENDLPVNSRAGVTVGILGSKNGRAVGNYVTDEHPNDTNGACPDGEQGAISGNALSRDQISNWKVFGNMIEDYGCAGTTKQHHTTYFSNRSGNNEGTELYNLSLVSPEVGYNYLKNNKASGGLNYFDEYATGVPCGDFITTFKFHNNVVINQTGQGINNYAKCPITTTFEYYNNIVMNSGVYDPRNDLLADPTKKLNNFESVTVAQSAGAEANTSTVNFYNNTFINWDVDDQKGASGACLRLDAAEGTMTINWNNNICVTNLDKPFIASGAVGTALLDRISGGGNVWYSSAATQVNAVAPAWDTTKITNDPLLTVTGSQVTIGAGSPILEVGDVNVNAPRDVMGTVRGNAATPGGNQQ